MSANDTIRDAMQVRRGGMTPSTKVPVACVNCGREVRRTPGQLRRRKKVFCSRGCFELWEKERALARAIDALDRSGVLRK